MCFESGVLGTVHELRDTVPELMAKETDTVFVIDVNTAEARHVALSSLCAPSDYTTTVRKDL